MNNRIRFLGISMNAAVGVLFCCMVLVAGGGRLSAQQLSANTVYPEFTIGPTGIRATIVNLEVVVQSTKAGSPAATSGLQAADVLLSAQVVGTGQVVSFAGADPRVPLGKMIDLAEGSNGQLTFQVRRGTTTVTKSLTLPVIGSYGATWPLGDAKSETIVNQLAAYIAASQKANNDYVFGGTTVSYGSLQGALAGLFLLSTDNPAYLGEVRDQARALAASAETRSNAGGHICWALGYQGIFLAEYYLRTGDAQVLPGLEELCAWCIDVQTAGGWGHGSDLNPGYVQSGLMNHTTVPILIALTLAKECGVAVDDAGYNAAWNFCYRFAGHGTVPYGDHRPETGMAANGRNAMFACALSLLDAPQFKAAAAETALTVSDSYPSPESGHTGGGFNVIWRAIGAAHVPVGKIDHYQRHMDHMAWMYDLCRQPEGNFELLATPPNESRYAGAVWGTGGLGLTYTAPRATLRMTGGPPTAYSVKDGSGHVVANLPTIHWGTAADQEFFSTEHADGFGAETDEPHEMWAKLSDGSESVSWYGKYLRHYNPVVRLAAARKLASLNTSASRAELAAAASHPDPRVRRAVFEGLVNYESFIASSPTISTSVVSSTFLPEIVATLSNPDAAWWEIDGALLALGRAEPADIRANRAFIDQFAAHSEWYLREAAFRALTGVGASITSEEFNKLTDIYASSGHVWERGMMDNGFDKIMQTNHSAFACSQRVNSVRKLGATFDTIEVQPGYQERGDDEAMHRTMMILDHFDPEIYKYLVPDFARYLETWKPGTQHGDWLIVGNGWQPGILSVLGNHLGAYGKPVVEQLDRILANYSSYPSGTAAQKLAIQAAVNLWHQSYDPNAFPALLKSPRLTAYYNFENSFDDAPGAGFSSDNLISLGVTFSTDVPVGGGAHSAAFNGTAALLSNTFSADLGPDSDDYTVMFWIKANDASQAAGDSPVISTRVRPAGGGATEPAWQVDGPGGPADHLSLRFNPGPCVASNWECPAAVGAVASTSGAAAWHHVAFVVSNAGHPSFNGDAYSRTFVDGVEVGLEDETPWTDLGVGNREGMLIIGGNAIAGGGSGFTGLLDDVALFSGVVSDNDIAAIAAGTQAPDDPLRGNLLPANNPPVLGASSTTAVFPDGALVSCQLQQDSAMVSVVWAFADQGETSPETWAAAEGGGRTGIGQYAPSATPMSFTISGLLPGKHYVYRFYAINALGHAWSSASGFTTVTSATAGYQGSIVAYLPFDTFYETGNNPAGTPQGKHEGMFADLSGNNQTAFAADVSNGNYVPMGTGKFGNAFYSKTPTSDKNNGAMAVIPHSNSLNFSGKDFTISFWEKAAYRSLAGSGAGSGKSMFFMKAPSMTGATGIKGFGLCLDANTLRLYGNDSDNFGQETLGGAAYTFPNPAPAAAVDSNQWAHWALTSKYNSATNTHTMRVYLNGIVIDWNGSTVGTSFTVSNDVIDNDGDLTIGSFWRAGSWSYQRFASVGMTPDVTTIPGEAWIDDYAIWNVALGAANIGELAAGTSPLFVGAATNPHAPAVVDATFEVAENSSSGTDIGEVAASDPDVGDVLTYSIAVGNSAGLFAINPESELISVAGAIDYEAASQYVLTVAVTDNGEPVRVGIATITVNVTNVPENNGEVVNVALTGIGGPFAGQAGPDVIGFTANPDHDSWANAFEVLFGFDAAIANGGSPIRTRFVDEAGQSFLEAVIDVDAAMDDLLTWHVEWSSDLTTWRESAMPHVVVGETGGTRTISVRDDQPAPGTLKRFVRAVISASGSR